MEPKKAVNENASSFMLEEYKQIAAAFFDLSKQKTEMFRFYLILVTIPITLIAAIIGLEDSPFTFFSLPDIVILMLFAISIAGLIMGAIIVDIRFECIIYSKTVNLARRFFIDNNEKQKLGEYTLLPNGDDVPYFNEQPWQFNKRTWKWNLGVGATFLEVVLMGLLNATYFASAIVNIAIRYTNFNWSLVILLTSWILFFLIHVLGYLGISRKKDTEWNIKKESQ